MRLVEVLPVRACIEAVSALRMFDHECGTIFSLLEVGPEYERKGPRSL